MTTTTVEAPCVTCRGEGEVDCADDRRVKKCTDPECTRHIHTCENCRGSGLKKDQWYGPGIEVPLYRIHKPSRGWDT
jgi:hypothetical protein